MSKIINYEEIKYRSDKLTEEYEKKYYTNDTLFNIVLLTESLQTINNVEDDIIKYFRDKLERHIIEDCFILCQDIYSSICCELYLFGIYDNSDKFEFSYIWTISDLFMYLSDKSCYELKTEYLYLSEENKYEVLNKYTNNQNILDILGIKINRYEKYLEKLENIRQLQRKWGHVILRANKTNKEKTKLYNSNKEFNNFFKDYFGLKKYVGSNIIKYIS